MTDSSKGLHWERWWREVENMCTYTHRWATLLCAK